MLIGEMVEKVLSLADNGVFISVLCDSKRDVVVFFVHAGKQCVSLTCYMSDTFETMKDRYEVAETEAIERRDADVSM